MGSLKIFQLLALKKQGHHHNGDEAARRPTMMCSICGRCPSNFQNFSTPWGSGIGPFGSPPMGSYLPPVTHLVYLLPFLSYLACSKSTSIRPGYDDKYRSRSYRFVEQQQTNSDEYDNIKKTTDIRGTSLK